MVEAILGGRAAGAAGADDAGGADAAVSLEVEKAAEWKAIAGSTATGPADQTVLGHSVQKLNCLSL